MSVFKLPKKLKKISRSAVRTVLLCAAGFCALLLVLLAALPSLVSSDFLRARLVGLIESNTGKPARLEALSFGWTQGLFAHGLRIGEGDMDDAAFLARLDDLSIRVDPLAALRGELVLSMRLKGLRLRVPHSEEQKPSTPLPQALREAFASARGLRGLSLPGRDAAMDVELSDMALLIVPAQGGKPIRITGASFAAATQSLRAKPLRLALKADLAIADAKPAPVRLDVAIDGFADADGRLRPAKAVVEAAGDAPGLDLTLKGSLLTKLDMSLRARLGEALAPARALAPALPDVGGGLSVGISAALPENDALRLGVVVFADKLRASGGSLGARRAGPLSLSLLQEAEADLAAGTARLPGSLDLGAGGSVRWEARLSDINKKKTAPRVEADVSGLRLTLGPLLPALRGLLPPGLSLRDATIDAQNASFAAALPEGDSALKQEIRVRGLAVTLRDVSRRDAAKPAAGGALRLSGVQLRVPSADVTPAASGKGSDMAAQLEAELDGLRLDGPGGTKNISAGRVTLPGIVLRATALRPDAAALFALAGAADVEISLRVEKAEAAGKAALPALDAGLRLHADLPAAKTAAVDLQELRADAPILRVAGKGGKTMEAPLRLRACAPGITLAGAPPAPALRGLSADIGLGPALACTLRADLSPTQSGRLLRTEGDARIDAARLAALAAPLLPPTAKATGTAQARWKIDATLPEAAANANPAKAGSPVPLSRTLKQLSFLRTAQATLRLDAIGLDWPLAAKPGQNAQMLRLKGVSTPRPLRFSATNGAGEATLAGSLSFGPLESLPGAGKLARPLRGLLTLDAAQQDGRSVQVTESLHLDGFELDQNLSLTLDKLDAVLDREDKAEAALEFLDARLGFKLTAGAQALSTQAGRGRSVSAKGKLEATAEARLEGGKSLALSTNLFSPGLDLALGRELAVTGLTSNIRFARRYSLARGLLCPDAARAQTVPLSAQVFDQFPSTAGGFGAQEALGQLLRRRPGAPADGVFAFSRLRMKAAGLPLDIHDVELRLDTSGPVPGLRAFRAGLLGGGVLGSALVRKAAGSYSLEADMAFTGIDPARFFPPAKGRDPAGQSETSGRFALSVPLTPDAEALLQRLRLRADLTRIGPRTLERMLYALDPQEQNEAIVQQRRLMGIGYPRHLRVAAEYGNLSLTGAVDVKGFQLDLPPVERLPIGNLPLRDKLAKPLAGVPTLVRALDAASGTRICRDPADPKKALRVVEPAATKGAAQ
jgi:hypothetical protein